MLGVGALLLDLSIYGLVYGEVAGFLGFGVALLCPPGRSRAIAIAVNVGAIALAAVLWLVFATVG